MLNHFAVVVIQIQCADPFRRRGHAIGPEHVPQHGPRTRPTTWALNTSHNMGPKHVPQHVPRTHPTTWAPNTSHNMGPEHISQHGSQARPTSWAPNTSPASTYQYPLVPAGTHLFPPVPAVPASTRQIHQVRRPATHGTTVMVTFQVACSFCKIVDISTRSSGGPLRFESVTG